MKREIILLLIGFGVACTNAPQPVVQNSNNAVTANREKPQTAIAHSSENKMPPSYPSNSAPAGGAKWSGGGEAIDTATFDASIMTAEKALADGPKDETAKKNLSLAFLERAMALTQARQYASALGDYRRTLKYDASNAEAKQWVKEITSIYSKMGRPAPKEGEEPPPMPFNQK